STSAPSRRTSDLIEYRFRHEVTERYRVVGVYGNLQISKKQASTSSIKLLPQYPRKNEGGNDGRIRFDNEFRRVDVQLAPGNFLIRHGTGVRAVRGRGI